MRNLYDKVSAPQRKKSLARHVKGEKRDGPSDPQTTDPNSPPASYAADGDDGNKIRRRRIPHLGQRSRAMFTADASQILQHSSANRSRFINLASPNATAAKYADLLIIEIPSLRG
jgi:hypothetical protein